MSRRILPIVLAVGLLGLVACSDDAFTSPRTHLSPEGKQSFNALPQVRSIVRPGEERSAAFGKGIVGFAGHYWDGAKLVVLLTDTTVGAGARAALAHGAKSLRMVPPRFEGRPIEVIFHRADYEFSQLRVWRDKLQNSLWVIPGVSLLTVDERGNRLRVGVENQTVRSRVQSLLDSLSVPRAAVVLEINSVRLDTTLRNYVRPLEGGLQIASAMYYCTLGFNAWWSGSGNNVWLTASHCTNQFWSTDYTDFYQPYDGAEEYAGYESYDPGGFSCSGSNVCRYSDAAIMNRPSFVTYDVAKLAQTTAYGSITISASAPHLTVVQQVLWPDVGWGVAKMGRTTGWTHGTIRYVDVDISEFPGTVTLNQVEADYEGASGDSGAPVFSDPPQSNQVAMYGLHIAHLTVSPYYAIFSPLGGIMNDLGTMDTTTPPSGGGGGGGGGGCVDENGNPIPC